MNKLLLTIILIGGAVGLAVYLSSTKSNEGFWNLPSRTWKVEKLLSDGSPALGSGAPMNQDFFQSPNFQSILAPRFSNVNYGPYIRTVLPAYNRMGVPEDPLSENVGSNSGYSNLASRAAYRNVNDINPVEFALLSDKNGSVNGISNSGKMIDLRNNNVEKFRSGATVIPLDPHNAHSAAYANGDYNQVLAQVYAAGGGPLPTSTVMEGVSETPFMNQDGELKQPIVYDRYIYANRRSRLRSQGDPIRGDLPIVPLSGDWFVPSVQPQIDLQAGALNVMAGVNNATNNELANLIYNSSGGGDTTIGGVNMRDMNMSHQVYGAASAAQGDVQMTAFP